jgi:hypothetical protein
MFQSYSRLENHMTAVEQAVVGGPLDWHWETVDYLVSVYVGD